MSEWKLLCAVSFLSHSHVTASEPTTSSSPIRPMKIDSAPGRFGRFRINLTSKHKRVSRLDVVDSARSRHRVPEGGSSVTAKWLATFLRRSEGRKWHLADKSATPTFVRYWTKWVSPSHTSVPLIALRDGKPAKASRRWD